jgi:hypothetical protein
MTIDMQCDAPDEVQRNWIGAKKINVASAITEIAIQI